MGQTNVLGLVNISQHWTLCLLVTQRFWAGVALPSILFICPGVAHVVCDNYSICHLSHPRCMRGGTRAVLYLWDAFQNSFISVISPPSLRVSWHICGDCPACLLALGIVEDTWFLPVQHRGRGMRVCGLSSKHLSVLETFPQVCWGDIC